MKFLILIIFSSFLFCKAQNFSFSIPPFDSSEQTYLPLFPKQLIKDGEFVGTNNSDFVLNGQPIRFFGSNLVADGAFPEKIDAKKVAAHIRKTGINLLRLHHMDNNWGTSSFFLNTPNTRTINETYRDKLEYLIYNLKEQGIYIDMNLLVSRMFRNSDGIPGADSITDFEQWKSPALFVPDLLKLQKEFAKNLLLHVNPYTGKSLVNDPVMALVEISNENSIFRHWIEGRLKPFAVGGTLLFRHSVLLDSLWNVFLKNKYGNTLTLQNAWNSGVNTTQINFVKNGNFETGNTSNWVIEKNGTTTGTFIADNSVAWRDNYSGKVTVSNYDGTDWHYQLKQIGLSTIKDSMYEVEFYAMSYDKMKINAYVSLDVSPWETYTWNSYDINSEWKKISFSFRAPKTVNQTIRLGISFTGNGTVWVDNFFFGTPTVNGVSANESLENANIKRIDYADRIKYTSSRVNDQFEFYIQLEKKYFNVMKNYLKDSLNVKVPVTGSNMFSGPEDLFMEHDMDYLDNHAYWDHPSFPGIPWSATDWNIKNQPMMKSLDYGTIPNLFSGLCLKNKPFTISEYNHPYPNQYQSEMLPMITSYAAFAGADAIMFFDYNGQKIWDQDMMNGYFDIQRNNAVMAAMPVFAYAYRNHLINESGNEITLNYSHNDIFGNIRDNTQAPWGTKIAVPRELSLTNKITTDSLNATTSVSNQQLPVAKQNPYITNDSQISWDTQGLFAINTEQFISVSGELNNHLNHKTGNLTILSADEFGCVSWLSLDSLPLTNSKRSLMVLNKFQENTNMIWYDNHTTLKNSWGNAPTIQVPMNVTLRLAVDAKAIRIFRLDASGKETISNSILVEPKSTGNFELNLNQSNDQTLWYGIQTFDSDTILSVRDFSSLTNQPSLKILNNPVRDIMTVQTFLPENDQIKISILNMIGGEVSPVYSGTVAKGTHEINFNTTSLEAGIYFCVMQTAQKKVVQKFIINK